MRANERAHLVDRLDRFHGFHADVDPLDPSSGYRIRCVPFRIQMCSTSAYSYPDLDACARALAARRTLSS